MLIKGSPEYPGCQHSQSRFLCLSPLKESGFGKQFKDAGKSGARYALILGDEEEHQSKVKIKDLKSSEITVDQTQLIHQLEKLDQEGGINS